MIPTQISLSIPNTSPKLQSCFPIDPRSDITIIYNTSTQFKLRKAYLKCWSKYFQRQLKSSVQTFNINQQYNSQQFRNVMSIFYGYVIKVKVKQLIQYYRITNYLEIKQTITNIRDHLMAFHDSFDHFVLLNQSLKWKDQEMKQFILSTILNKNMAEITKRRDEVLGMEVDSFKSIVELIANNINSNNNTFNWKSLNALIKEYTNKKGKEQLYFELRQEYILESKLTAEQYSSIFSGESKLPPISKKATNKIQLSQLIENKSVFFGSQLLNDFNKMMQKYNKNNQKFAKIEQRVNKLQHKSSLVDELFGKTDVDINLLKNQFKRYNSVPVNHYTLQQSQSKPFLDDILPTENSQNITNKIAFNNSPNRQSFGITNHISSQQPLTFSVKSQSIRQDQVSNLQRILGFDSFSRGFLKLIFRADKTTTKQMFLQAIHGKQDLVFLIYVFQDNKNIGVYTSTKISTNISQNRDSQSFIFSVNNDMKFKTKDPSKSIMFSQDYLISFSQDIKLNNDILQEMSECKWPVSYQGHKVTSNKADWLVGNQMFHVNEFQVYEIIRIQIKMEMDMDL